jgi:hypothetical protein
LIPSLAWLASAWAQEAPPESTEPAPIEDPLLPHRVRFDVLADRAIGTTSVPVAFDWRRNTLQLAATGSLLVELNNFNSVRGGLLARVPTGDVLVEVGVSYARVWDTPSSQLLALTPYRQPGRPDRLELDLAVGLPLAEGVVTTAPKFFPAVQMAFLGYAGFRYSVYPTGWPGMRPGQVFRAILSPSLTEIEIDNLDDDRPEAMAIDPGRYGLLMGVGNDIYFEQGLFLSPRVMFAVPILAPASGTDLLFWADISLALGFAW